MVELVKTLFIIETENKLYIVEEVHSLEADKKRYQ